MATNKDPFKPHSYQSCMPPCYSEIIESDNETSFSGNSANTSTQLCTSINSMQNKDLNFSHERTLLRDIQESAEPLVNQQPAGFSIPLDDSEMYRNLPCKRHLPPRVNAPYHFFTKFVFQPLLIMTP